MYLEKSVLLIIMSLKQEGCNGRLVKILNAPVAGCVASCDRRISETAVWGNAGSVTVSNNSCSAGWAFVVTIFAVPKAN